MSVTDPSMVPRLRFRVRQMEDLLRQLNALIDGRGWALAPDPEPVYSEAQAADAGHSYEEDAAHRAILKEVAAERARQVLAEGYTYDHDDEHDRGQIARAGAAYALAAGGLKAASGVYWPWEAAGFKPWAAGHWRRRCLVKAMALLCAEVERLDRSEASS